jgi:hypothetical protein
MKQLRKEKKYNQALSFNLTRLKFWQKDNTVIYTLLIPRGLIF